MIPTTGQKPLALEYSGLISSTQEVFHYTCNPPAHAILDKYAIRAIGNAFGCRDPREVLMIPVDVYNKNNIPTENISNWTLVSEQLLRKLGEK